MIWKKKKKSAVLATAKFSTMLTSYSACVCAFPLKTIIVRGLSPGGLIQVGGKELHCNYKPLARFLSF